MKIYFKKRKKTENIQGIKELLRLGYLGREGNFKETFKDEECTVPECHAARRSFGDLLSICKTYFPQTKEKELAKVLYELNEDIGVGGSYCTTIQKPVFFVRGKGIGLDRFFQGRAATIKGKGKYSFKMIEKLAKQE